MGRSGHIKSPDLPHGPHRQLLDLMHELLAKSGLSGRAAAKAAGMPNSTFQKALSQPELPTLNTAMAIILALAAAIDDREEYLDDIDQRAKRLWVQADRAAAGPDPIEVAARELWTDIMRGSGYIPDLHCEVRWALDRAIEWSLSYEHGGVTVWMWLPDWDTEEALNDHASWQDIVSHTLSERVGKFVQMSVIVDVDEEGEEGTEGHHGDASLSPSPEGASGGALTTVRVDDES